MPAVEVHQEHDLSSKRRQGQLTFFHQQSISAARAGHGADDLFLAVMSPAVDERTLHGGSTCRLLQVLVQHVQHMNQLAIAMNEGLMAGSVQALVWVALYQHNSIVTAVYVLHVCMLVLPAPAGHVVRTGGQQHSTAAAPEPRGGLHSHQAA